MENRIQDYLDYIELGNEMAEDERRKVVRTTRSIVRSKLGTITTETTEEIEFT